MGWSLPCGGGSPSRAIPPPIAAVLDEKVEARTAASWILLVCGRKRPPPVPDASLPAIVLLTIVISAPVDAIPPPFAAAFPTTATAVSVVSENPIRIPPPSSAPASPSFTLSLRIA